MPELEQTGVQLVAETSQYDRAMSQVIASAGQVDSALDRVVNAANDAGKSLNAIDGNVNVNIKTGISDDSAINRIEGLADEDVIINVTETGLDQIASQLTGIADEPVMVNVTETGIAGIASQLTGIADEPVAVNVTETGITAIETQLTGIADEAVNIDVSETGLTAIENRISGVADETVNIKTKLTDESGIDEVNSKLESLKKLATINIALQLAGGAQQIVEQLQSLPGVGALNDIDNASRMLGAATGGKVDPGLLELAKSLNENAFASSITDAAIFINQLKGMGIEGDDNLTKVAFGAYQVRDAFTAMGQDVDLQTVAIAQQQLVTNNLVDSYQEAADLLSAGETSGLNIGDDMIDSVIEYADSFETLGLKGSEVFDIYKTGLSSGFKNTDFISALLREFSINLGEAAADPKSTQAQALKALGLDNPRALGEQVGGDFVKATFDAIANAPVADRPTLLSTLFGSQSEDYAGAAATLNQIEPTFAGIEGRAKETSDFLNNTLGTILTGFFNTINIKIAELLSSDKIDIPGKIEEIKKAVNTFIGELSAGGTFASALGLTLGIDETAIQRVESIFGNFVLALMDVASIIAGLAGQKDAMNAIRRASFDQAKTQFVFDAKLAIDQQDLEDQIALASFRGFTSQDVKAGLGQAITELIDEGNLEGARQLALNLNKVQGSGGNTVNGINVDESIPFLERTQALDAYDTAVQNVVNSINNADFDTFFANIGKVNDPALLRSGFDRAAGLNFPGVAQQIVDQIGQQDPDTATALQPIVDSMKADLTQRMTEAVDNGDFEFARQIAEKGLGDADLLTAIDELQQGSSEKWDALVGDVETARTDISTTLDTSADDVTSYANTSVTQLDRVSQAYAAVAAQAQAALTAKTTFDEGGASPSPDHKAAGGDLKAGNTWTGEAGPEIVTSDGSGSVINAARSVELMQAISAIARVPAAGGGGNVTNNYITLNQSNHSRSAAQANMIGMQTANQVRGFVA